MATKAKKATKTTQRSAKRPSRKTKVTVRVGPGSFLADSKRDVVIYDHPTKPGKFCAEPFRVLLVASEGPHTIRFWNQTDASDVILHLSGPLGGRQTIPLDQGRHDQAIVGATHPRRKITYKIRAAHASEPESSGALPVLGAADPQIIIE